MAAEYELIRHGKMSQLNMFVNRIIYRSNHMHSDFELMYVLDGEGSCSTQNHTYSLKPGAIILLNSNEPHDITGLDFGVTLLLIQFSRGFLQEYYPDFSRTVFSDGDVLLSYPIERQTLLQRAVLEAGIEYLSGGQYYELECISRMSRILRQFLIFLPKEIVALEEQQKRAKVEQRMVRISSYLETNYPLQIRLSDLAAEEGITTTHLSHFITEHFGMTFQEYLGNIRFEHAVRIIGNPHLTLSEVSAESGFSELKYMTRMFEKQLGMKPADFREQLPPLVHESVDNKQTLEYYLSDEEGLQELLVARNFI